MSRVAGIKLTHRFTGNKTVGILKKKGTNLWDTVPDSENPAVSTVISKKKYWQKIEQWTEEKTVANEPTRKEKNLLFPLQSPSYNNLFSITKAYIFNTTFRHQQIILHFAKLSFIGKANENAFCQF